MSGDKPGANLGSSTEKSDRSNAIDDASYKSPLITDDL